jgi:hypothetical protein
MVLPGFTHFDRDETRLGINWAWFDRSVFNAAILVLPGFTGPMPGWAWAAPVVIRGC